MSDDSDSTNKTDKRCKRPLKASRSTDSSDSGSPLAITKRSRKQLVVASDDESSSSEDEEIIAIRPSIRRGYIPLLSDYESGTSNAGDDGGSESDGNFSEQESRQIKNPAGDNKMDEGASGSSSDSDGQSERCPICLIKFVSQEVGTPETCDHFFCAPCLLEWSKNVNTCPVDRQPYKLILIREHLEGKVIRQVPVHEPSSDQEPQEDSTCCEICSLSNREETLLLCDGCDNGYHMECLNPPLEYVPIEEWYCPECAPRHRRGRSQGGSRRRQRDESEHEEEEEDREDDIVPLSRFRLVPRTRQSERVRRNVQRNNGGPQQVDAPMPSTSSGVESGGDRFRTSVRERATLRVRRRATTQSRRTGVRIKRIVTDDGVIEVILKCKKKGRKRRGRKKKRNRLTVSSPRTAKGRLAARLGMCRPRITKQKIPETVGKQEITSAPINHQRHQAGIPTLDLFGRRDQLDYFSGSEPEDDIGSMEGGVGLLSRARVARPSDRLMSRKKAASVLSSTSCRKPLKIEKLSSPAPAGPGLLDSILDSQTLWHSKKTEIKSNADGTLKVIPKDEILKEDKKVDVQKTTAPVKESPMFPGGRPNSGAYKPESSSRGGISQGGSRNYSERSEESSYQSSAPASSGFPRSEGSTGAGPSPLRGVAPIRFRMNIPPRRPNIHSYPSDNIPPPPPLRLRSPMAEMSFPATNSPDASPEREEEDVDIYSDIEQESSPAHETEERTFGALEPPPEPPFLMTMEPPPEPPAMLMNLNDDASDDEPSGLVIDDPPVGDVYDPCAVNSDDSSTGDVPLSKPPELPSALKNPELVANYSSDSCPTQGSSSYNPELPTYSSTPIIGPLPRPASHNSTDAEDNDEECPNFSLYSATSMKLAHRGLDLDIPIPPPIEKEIQEDSMDIPLPEENLPVSDDKEDSGDIPIPKEEKTDPQETQECKASDDARGTCKEETRDSDKYSEGGDGNKATINEDGDTEEKSVEEEEDGDDDDDDEEDDDNDDDEEEEVDDGKEEDTEDRIDKDKENKGAYDDKSGEKSEIESVHDDNEKVVKSKPIKNKDSEAGEDECSTQGDVLDLAIESEANLENNIPHDDSEEQNEITLAKSPVRIEESDDKIGDGGDKSDGLVDITDEEMSVYDGQDNTDLEKINEQIRETIQNEKQLAKSLDSDDDNSLIGGATSAVSAASFNNSDNIQTSTLPGLEGLETETISESEDVNFDELPLETHEQSEAVANEDELSSSRKKKRKKSRKISLNDETSTKGNNEPLEFEEGEIIEDKPKKDRKLKSKPETNVEVDENVDSKKAKQPVAEKEKDTAEKKTKKKKDKGSGNKERTDKNKEKEPKEKTLKPGEPDENISWKKLSKSTKERNYRDGKEKDDRDKERDKERDRDRENKEESSKKKSRERRKELERYDVRRLISEKPKRPKKDEFGRDISPSSSSLSPYRPPRYRSPLRTKNRSRTRSRSWRSQSRSRGRKRRSRSRERVRSRERPKRSRTRDRSRRRSRSKNRVASRSRDRRRSPEKTDRVKTGHRSLSRGRRKTRSRSHHSHHSKKHRSSYSKSWTPSWSKSSMSRSRSPRHRRRSKSISRSRSRSWSRERVPSARGVRTKEPPKNLTVIVPNKEAMKKKEKKKISKKKDDRRKKKRGQSPAPSKEVFTSGDNILVSVNFKNANKNPEIIPASTPLLRESSKRKRDDTVGDSSTKKKKSNSSSKKTPGKKSNRLAKINEAAKNAKPVAIIDLDVSPFRAQTPSPKEVIVLSDSGDEGDKQHHSEMQDEISRMGHSGINQSMLSLSSNDHGQKNSVSQPESPVSSFMHNSSGPKTPPEPHVKFSISTKQSQIRMLNNPLMEAEEEMQDDNIENEVNEIMHKGPNTPPEPPPEMTTPASPPTTPYDPFDPTKSRSPSPQPRSDAGSQLNTSREDKLENIQTTDDDHPSLNEPRTLTPPNEMEETRKTPEPPKVHSTPKNDTNTEISPKVSPPTGSTEPKLAEDSLMQPIKKLLADANKLNVTVHKSPEKLITVVISQQTKNLNQTPKQPVLPLKAITPIKQLTPKTNSKHQLFSTSIVKQVPILGTLLPGPPVYTPSSGLNNSKLSNRSQQNGDTFEDMDIDPSSPYSPGSSEGDDLFEPPMLSPPRSSSKPSTNKSKPASANKFDSLFGSSPAKNRHGRYSKSARKAAKPKSKGSKKEEVKVKLDEDQLKILDDLPSSAVEMQVKDKFLKKLNRQERVVEEVKLVLKPHYAKKHVNKDEYKEILRRSVPKICHNKSGEINPIKIQHLVEAYVKKFRYAKKKAAGAIPAPAAQNKPKPQKTLWS